MENVDGYVVVYSITDRKSFKTSKEMLRSLNHGFEIVGYSPVCLIGNKLDLNHMTPNIKPCVPWKVLANLDSLHVLTCGESKHDSYAMPIL
ncbi:ras-related and estrogen-regulated growth inhibitor-like protein [Nephila pilipes]|uniref:small monomeric GTPase n=1 Tax=Nephila pilipes TaxID=299642 RepID=A0A8X6NYX9_NEPPI|nr:ras-related and estrogen-regulated growth inhibitor-like protein [Nephila pilipes]